MLYGLDVEPNQITIAFTAAIGAVGGLSLFVFFDGIVVYVVLGDGVMLLLMLILVWCCG